MFLISICLWFGEQTGIIGNVNLQMKGVYMPWLRFFHCLWYQGNGFFHLRAMLTLPHGGLFPDWFVVF